MRGRGRRFPTRGRGLRSPSRVPVLGRSGGPGPSRCRKEMCGGSRTCHRWDRQRASPCGEHRIGYRKRCGWRPSSHRCCSSEPDPIVSGFRVFAAQERPPRSKPDSPFDLLRIAGIRCRSLSVSGRVFAGKIRRSARRFGAHHPGVEHLHPLMQNPYQPPDITPSPYAATRTELGGFPSNPISIHARVWSAR